MRRPRAMVLTAPGINRDVATKCAYELAGAEADIVHINQLKGREVEVERYQIISIPGGFSYGDHIQSGRVLALELQQDVVAEQIYAHLGKGRFIIGVCNGFQALVQCGLLPFGKIQPLPDNVSTLTFNQQGRFESRWIYLQPQRSRCLFLSNGAPVTFPVAHGEGQFLTLDEPVFQRLLNAGQVVYQYCTSAGEVTERYPSNPNGSPYGIAAICDESGQVLGMMPHAEDFVRREHHPNWRRLGPSLYPDGLQFFESIVAAAKQL